MALFVKNPFRSESPRRAFDLAVFEYECRGPALFKGKGGHGKGRRRDSEYASAFWLGYEQGEVSSSVVPKGTPAWVAWRAGLAVWRAEEASKRSTEEK